MSFFPLKMQTLKHPNHKSTCPICLDTDNQSGWVLGIINLNFTIIRATAIINNYIFEATFSYCPPCDFGYFFPTPSQELLNEFYALGGGRKKSSDEVELSSLKGATLRRDNAAVFSLLHDAGIDLEKFSNCRVLEVGAGYGSFASACLEHGMQYWANEIGVESADFIERVFKVPVIRENLEDISSKYDSSFDLILTKDSLEHHPNPALSLRKMYELLSPNGWLIITVPNLHSFAFNETSITHPYYAFPPHLNYFSSNTFSKLLGDFGMKNIRVQTFSFVSEIFYCMELGMKLGLIRPEHDHLENLSKLGQHERILVIAQK
jgi:SAM-dependent methyltransferase